MLCDIFGQVNLKLDHFWLPIQVIIKLNDQFDWFVIWHDSASCGVTMAQLRWCQRYDACSCVLTDPVCVPDINSVNAASYVSCCKDTSGEIWPVCCDLWSGLVAFGRASVRPLVCHLILHQPNSTAPICPLQHDLIGTALACFQRRAVSLPVCDHHYRRSLTSRSKYAS